MSELQAIGLYLRLFAMIVRVQHLRPIPTFLHPIPKLMPQCFHFRRQYASKVAVPPPTPFVPDVQTFLTLIGRGLSKHAPKIPSWEALFTLKSNDLRELGIDPARTRRYLLQCRQKFREGRFGIGGDLQEVVNGVAKLRVVEQPVPQNPAAPARIATATTSPGTRKIVVNVPPDSTAPSVPLEEAKPVKHMKVIGAYTIKGPHVQLLKGTRGSAATLAVKEGLWEVKRGRKIDGGERRRAEVRAKRRAEERKVTRA
jgi:IGR protein motif